MKKIKFLIVVTYIFFTCNLNLSADEFNFEGEEIQILDEGNRLVSKKGVKVTTNNGLILEGENFEYNKTKLELVLSDEVIINDKRKNIIIKTDQIRYSKKNEKLFTYKSTNIQISDNYLVESSDIIFDRNIGLLKSNSETSIIDKYNNKILSDNFNYFLDDQLIKAKNLISIN